MHMYTYCMYIFIYVCVYHLGLITALPVFNEWGILYMESSRINDGPFYIQWFIYHWICCCGNCLVKTIKYIYRIIKIKILNIKLKKSTCKMVDFRIKTKIMTIKKS